MRLQGPLSVKYFLEIMWILRTVNESFHKGGESQSQPLTQNLPEDSKHPSHGNVVFSGAFISCGSMLSEWNLILGDIY